MIYFECYADESLLRSLGFTARDLSGGHSHSRSKVSSKLSKSTNSVGLVDEDPMSPRDSYLTDLFSRVPLYEDANLFAFGDLRKNNKLVVLRPNLESWVIRIARDQKVSLREYMLADTEDSLHDMLAPKTNTTKRQQLVSFISDNIEHRSIAKLKQILNQ